MFPSLAQTIFSFLALGVEKKTRDINDFLETFVRNLTADKRTILLNLKLLFADESFLFSNLIFAVFYAIFEHLFQSPDVCPLSRLQICFIGDPKQLLVHDRDEYPAKNYSFAKGVRDLEGDEFFSNFFEKLMLTGLRILFLKICHRSSESHFLQTLDEVRKKFVFYFSNAMKENLSDPKITSRFEMVLGMKRYVRQYHNLEKVKD